MTDKTNPFGGKNPHGMYVPITDDEMEVLERLAQAEEFRIVIKDWGYVDKLKIVFGDKNAHFYFTMHFNAPVVPQPNWYFDIELWAKGHKLFAQRMPTQTGGKPIEIVAGLELQLCLDISLDQIDPKIVKEIKPGSIGLTSRHGNMHLDSENKRILSDLQNSEARVRKMSEQEATKATKDMKDATGQ